ncbi:hypothetical protein B0H34DRAFT_808092 [Crassisporium funariophilum]|nr:hypothetical protein B0H34DRAFT_808092 [Crassisporium funariophilum]
MTGLMKSTASTRLYSTVRAVVGSFESLQGCRHLHDNPHRELTNNPSPEAPSPALRFPPKAHVARSTSGSQNRPTYNARRSKRARLCEQCAMAPYIRTVRAVVDPRKSLQIDICHRAPWAFRASLDLESEGAAEPQRIRNRNNSVGESMSHPTTSTQISDIGSLARTAKIMHIRNPNNTTLLTDPTHWLSATVSTSTTGQQKDDVIAIATVPDRVAQDNRAGRAYEQRFLVRVLNTIEDSPPDDLDIQALLTGRRPVFTSTTIQQKDDEIAMATATLHAQCLTGCGATEQRGDRRHCNKTVGLYCKRAMQAPANKNAYESRNYSFRTGDEHYPSGPGGPCGPGTKHIEARSTYVQTQIRINYYIRPAHLSLSIIASANGIPDHFRTVSYPLLWDRNRRGDGFGTQTGISTFICQRQLDTERRLAPRSSFWGKEQRREYLRHAAVGGWRYMDMDVYSYKQEQMLGLDLENNIPSDAHLSTRSHTHALSIGVAVEMRKASEFFFEGRGCENGSSTPQETNKHTLIVGALPTMIADSLVLVALGIWGAFYLHAFQC